MSYEAPEALAEVPVFLGGPVGTNQLGMFASLIGKSLHPLASIKMLHRREAHQLAERDRKILSAPCWLCRLVCRPVGK